MELDKLSIPRKVQHWANKHPDDEALVFVSKDGPRTALTCADVFNKSKVFGLHLLQLGVSPGSVVVNLLDDSPEAFLVFFGTQFAGCKSMKLIIGPGDDEFLIHLLNSTNCQTIVISSDPENAATKILSKLIHRMPGNKVTSNAIPSLKFVVDSKDIDVNQVGFIWDEESINSGSVDIEDTIDNGGVLMASSGTAGAIKIIELSRQGLQTGMYIMFPCVMDEYPNSTMFNMRKLFWFLGIPQWYLCTGNRSVHIDNRFPIPEDDLPKFVFDTIINESCECAKLDPMTCSKFNYFLQSDHKLRNKWPLKVVWTGGKPLTQSIKEVIGTVCHTFHNMYGSSEMNLLTMKKIEKDTEFEDFNSGSFFYDVKMKIIDENLKEVTNGASGHLTFQRSPYFFVGYVGNEELTKQSFSEDGYFFSKDYGRVKPNGELIIQGRTEDIVSRDGNIYHASQIESLVRKAPGVYQVTVINVTVNQKEDLCACIVPRVGVSVSEQDKYKPTWN
ncbi:hypothetical protein LOTGIDRAFT_152790 [Lottia gigantea]|uniref:AMP-dependent synthetase/ligase domain-containing protein n=1 Tax=Lottia gigantea TaxID=225164 RepID=V4AS56_LOTGI|nr:hypothetical protein LOTGIDRAFT_152790 [Lottia gigantea]ESO97700.1 hypothetical protein LOTGIDRAFT_152790 [Lottia gigantea]